MCRRSVLGTCLVILLAATGLSAAVNDVADTVMRGDGAEAVRTLLQQKVTETLQQAATETDFPFERLREFLDYVNAPQVDGATALHWAVRRDDLETTELLLTAGAEVSAANLEGATPLLLAAMTGNAAIIGKLIEAGADPNAGLTLNGDTALMLAARTGRTDAVGTLLDSGADVNALETWGGTTALMWAVEKNHLDAVKMLLDRDADVNAQSYYIPSATARGFEGALPVPPSPDQSPTEYANGWLTPMMFAVREGHMEIARTLVAAGADLDIVSADGKNSLALAIFNGQYEMASYLIDNGVDVNQADAQRFTPLFWAVDRRNMELATNGLPWTVTEDPYPLIEKLLDWGADPNAVVDNTPRARNRGASPRIIYASALARAAFTGDLDGSRLLLAYGADPHAKSSDKESMLEVATGLALIPGYQMERPPEERLELVKLFVELGEDVNWADAYGITPLMTAANLGHTDIVAYLVEQGADLGAYDLGKRLDGSFMSSVEPLMPVDYAIGVGTFLPNNSVVNHPESEELMFRLMAERGIAHTTSECTLRGFTCSTANVDPKTATPAEIVVMQRVQRGKDVDGLATGLDADEELANSSDSEQGDRPLFERQQQDQQQGQQ
jgi:ankyrin repeat protein